MKKNKSPYNKYYNKDASGLSRDNVPFAVVEAYKNIRTNLLSILSKTNGKTFVISSPYASEGKSTTSVNIAITLSQLNKKVIIVDADNRRPTVHKKLKLKNKVGLTNVLLGGETLENAMQQYNPYLDFLCAGHNVINPSELFSSSAFEEVLLKLKDTYDYVIFDTPPVNVVTDALVISQKCDGLALIVRTGFTTYDALGKALESIDMLGINLLGVIMNGSSNSFKSYYKYKHSYYKSYKYYTPNTENQQANN